MVALKSITLFIYITDFANDNQIAMTITHNIVLKNVASLVEPEGLETNVVHQYIESLSLQF